MRQLQQGLIGTQPPRGTALTSYTAGMSSFMCSFHQVYCRAGTRDFHPDEMRLQNWLFHHMAAVSRVFAFEQVDAPVLESEELFIRKAGEEITDQLYNFVVTVPGQPFLACLNAPAAVSSGLCTAPSKFKQPGCLHQCFSSCHMAC